MLRVSRFGSSIRLGFRGSMRREAGRPGLLGSASGTGLDRRAGLLFTATPERLQPPGSNFRSTHDGRSALRVRCGAQPGQLQEFSSSKYVARSTTHTSDLSASQLPPTAAMAREVTLWGGGSMRSECGPSHMRPGSPHCVRLSDRESPDLRGSSGCTSRCGQPASLISSRP